MARDREPVRIVERADRKRAQARIELELPRHAAGAVRAELHPQAAPALVRAMLVGLEPAAQLDVALLEVSAHAERAAGAALAAAAVAGGLAHRLLCPAGARCAPVGAAVCGV